MARPTVSLDPFEALAQPRRRQVLETLARYERPGCSVNELVIRLDLPQPVVSKHLAVLKEVGLVSVEKRGRQRMYQVNGAGMRTIHEWVGKFERFWTHQIQGIKEHAERRARELKEEKKENRS